MARKIHKQQQEHQTSNNTTTSNNIERNKKRNEIKANVEKSVIWINRLFRFGKMEKTIITTITNGKTTEKKRRYICRHSLRFYAHLSLWPSNSKIEIEREKRHFVMLEIHWNMPKSMAMKCAVCVCVCVCAQSILAKCLCFF